VTFAADCSHRTSPSSRRDRLSIALAIGSILLAAGCGGSADLLLLPGDGEPAAIRAENDGKSGRVGEPLADSLSFIVSDNRLRGVDRARIVFDVSAVPGAEIVPDTAETNAEGRAWVRMVLGTTIGEQTGQARVIVPDGTQAPSTNFTVMAVSENANEITISSGDPQSGPAGSTLALPLVVQVTDAFGNPISNVPISWTALGGGSVSEASNLTDGDGKASVQRTLGPTAGTQTTEAASPGLAGSPVTFTHTATAGSAAGLSIVSGDGQTGQVGQELPGDLVVLLSDASGNGVPGAAVTWVIGTGGGRVSPQNTVTDEAGRTSSRWTLGPNPGQNRVDAVVSGVGVVHFTATGTAARPAGVSIVTQPAGSTQNGAALTRQPVVLVRNEGGSPAAGVTVTAQLTGGGGALLGTRQLTTDGNGRVAYTDLAITGAEGPRRLVFTAGSFGGATSDVIVVRAIPTRTAITSDSPDPSVAGTQVTITVQVTAERVVPIGTVAITDGAQSCTATLTGGAGSCGIPLSTVGNRTLRATYAGSPGLNGSSDTEAHRVDQAAPSNNPPHADYNWTCDNLTCHFTNASTDSDGDVVRWSWNFGDGSAASDQREPTHTFPAAGGYDVTLTVTDNGGATDAASARVQVTAPPPPPPDNQPPTAAFTASCDHLSCSFNSDGSSDSDGSIRQYSWNFGDGNGSADRNPRHDYSTANTFDVTLTVTDDDGASGSVTHQVTTSLPDNKAPHAEFDVSCSDLTCSFQDRSSDDDGTIQSHNWDFGDGTGSNETNPSHTYATPGKRTVTLTVTDDRGGTATRQHDADPKAPPPPNQPPTAAFSFNCNTLACSFNSDGSSDPDGNIVSWTWDFGDGGSSDQRNPSHSYSAGGNYTVTLTVRDDDGAADSETQQVSVAAPNQPPVAAFTSSCADLTCSFNSSGSGDPDGTITSRSWNFGDGGSSSDGNPSHSYGSAATYNVTLTVTDNRGASSSVTHQVSPTAPNQNPTAAFNSSCTDLNCAFDSSASSDPDGSITSRSWDFGDGGSATSVTPNHSYVSAGNYDVRLTVTDNRGGTNSVTHQVTATAPNQPPTAAFTAPACTTGQSCQFTSSSTDRDGQVVAWTWDFDDGGGGSSAENPQHTYGASGNFNVKLRVRDNDGAQSSQVQHGVSVTDPPPPPNSPPVARIGSIVCTATHCDYTDASTDPNGNSTIDSYAWLFGDGEGSSAKNPSHDYAAAKDYTVTLTVTDDHGASDATSQTITVDAPPSGSGRAGKLIAQKRPS
jgi:PKD repeat protein